MAIGPQTRPGQAARGEGVGGLLQSSCCKVLLSGAPGSWGVLGAPGAWARHALQAVPRGSQDGRGFATFLAEVPLLSESCLGLCSTRRLERAVCAASGNGFPCHVTSVGYIATFHMAALTQAAVFMKILLILARSLPGAGGCVLAGLCSVWLTPVLGKASFSKGGALRGVGPPHPAQGHLPTCLSSRTSGALDPVS